MSGSLVTLDNLGDDAIVDSVNDQIHFTSIIEGTGAPAAAPPVPTKPWVYFDKATEPVSIYAWDTQAQEWAQAGGDAIAQTFDVVLVTQLPSEAVATGEGVFFFTVPEKLDGLRLTAANASVPGATGSTELQVQLVRLRGANDDDMLSTIITIDATETTSYTAAVPAVVDGDYDDLVTGDLIRVDVLADGSTAQGLQVILSVGA